MHTSQLISIGLFTAAVVLTLYAWMDRIRYSNRRITEAFENPNDPLSVPVAPPSVSVPDAPTDADAVAAHRTLLRYTSQNVANGLRFMTAIGKEFIKSPFTLRTDIDPSTLMNNYVSPLQI